MSIKSALILSAGMNPVHVRVTILRMAPELLPGISYRLRNGSMESPFSMRGLSTATRPSHSCVSRAQSSKLSLEPKDLLWSRSCKRTPLELVIVGRHEFVSGWCLLIGRSFEAIEDQFFPSIPSSEKMGFGLQSDGSSES